MRGGFYRLLVGPRKLGQRLGWRSASASTVVYQPWSGLPSCDRHLQSIGRSEGKTTSLLGT
jgi:hypothetical protein